MGAAIVLIQSALPIGMLIVPASGNPRAACASSAICGLLLLSAVLRAWWTAVPPLAPGVWDLVCVVTLGAATVFCAGWVARRSGQVLRDV